MPGGQAPHFVSGTGRFYNYLTFLSTGLLSSRRPQLSAAPSPFSSTPFPIPLSSLFLPPSQGPSSVLFLCLCPEQGPSLRRGRRARVECVLLPPVLSLPPARPIRAPSPLPRGAHSSQARLVPDRSEDGLSLHNDRFKPLFL